MWHFTVLIVLLRDRERFLREIRQGVKIKNKIAALLISSAIFLAIYGAIIGAYQSWLQVLASAVKLPALYLITLVICFPTLYFFNVLFGSVQSLEQQFALLLTAVSITSVLLFSFAPVTIFFLATINSYQWFLLLNVTIFAITGFIGIYFLYQAMKPVLIPTINVTDGERDADAAADEVNSVTDPDSDSKKVRTKILQFWLGLYAFVGSQLGWTLRPFFGAPGQPFELFREREGNFYLAVVKAIGHILF